MIHSTYASEAFWGILVFTLVLRPLRYSFPLCCFAWALAAGFRPSDGIFLLPLIFYAAYRATPLQRITGLAVAAAATTVWWWPSAEHYGGVISVATSALKQLRGANEHVSLLRIGVTPRSLANVARYACAFIWSSNILLLPAVVQAFRGGSEITRTALLWLLPGSIFLVFIYMSDAPYITFMVGSPLVLATMLLKKMGRPTIIAGLCSFLIISLATMVIARPVAPKSFVRRVMNAYVLEYSLWGISHRYHFNLSDLELHKDTSE